MNLPPLPQGAGSYRWLYADFSSGEWNAVVIFMIGSLFSRRYVVRGGEPFAHSAVNFVLYRGAKRSVWSLCEYPSMSAGEAWRIGRSQVRCDEHGATFSICQPKRGGALLEATLRLDCKQTPSRERVLLGSHTWQPLAPRAQATLTLGADTMYGFGYMDTNGGAQPLGTDLKRWSWARAHDAEATEILYDVEDGLRTRVRFVEHGEHEAPLTHQRRLARTGWGLSVPTELPFSHGVETPGVLLESSPFYARTVRPGVICESADLQRFRSPLIRWMADWRTRYEAEPV